MGKILESDYSLSSEHLTKEQIIKALSGDLEGFKFFFNNLCQLQDKDTRQMIVRITTASVLFWRRVRLANLL